MQLTKKRLAELKRLRQTQVPDATKKTGDLRSATGKPQHPKP